MSAPSGRCFATCLPASPASCIWYSLPESLQHESLPSDALLALTYSATQSYSACTSASSQPLSTELAASSPACSHNECCTTCTGPWGGQFLPPLLFPSRLLLLPPPPLLVHTTLLPAPVPLLPSGSNSGILLFLRVTLLPDHLSTLVCYLIYF